MAMGMTTTETRKPDKAKNHRQVMSHAHTHDSVDTGHEILHMTQWRLGMAHHILYTANHVHLVLTSNTKVMTVPAQSRSS